MTEQMLLKYYLLRRQYQHSLSADVRKQAHLLSRKLQRTPIAVKNISSDLVVQIYWFWKYDCDLEKNSHEIGNTIKDFGVLLSKRKELLNKRREISLELEKRFDELRLQYVA